MIEFWVAISLGLFGSFHCLGMCGPIALALPLGKLSPGARVVKSGVYNIGRILTYSVMGLLFGLIGQGFAMSGLQKWVSVVIGSLILLTILIPALSRWFNVTPAVARRLSTLKSSMGRRLQRTSTLSMFTLGLLNGLLPCGLVYIAIAAAIAGGNALNGAIFMALFGLGTVPMMFSLPLISGLISSKVRSRINAAIPYMMALVAILIILRGLELNIPYISPDLSGGIDEPKSCH